MRHAAHQGTLSCCHFLRISSSFSVRLLVSVLFSTKKELTPIISDTNNLAPLTPDVGTSVKREIVCSKQWFIGMRLAFPSRRSFRATGGNRDPARAFPASLKGGRERRERPLEDAQRVGDSQAVIRDRNAHRATAFETRNHLTPVLDAGAAVDDQPVGAQVAGETVARLVDEVEWAADVLREPTRYFHPADVIGDRVVAARLTNQHAVPWPKLFYSSRPLGLGDEV